MSSEVINGVTWNIHANGTITSASGYGSNVIVPDTVASITVVGFNNEIFKDQTTIQTISIPDSVTSLPTKFFGDSNNDTLTSVTFTENSTLTTIGQSAFHGCSSLSDFKIPSTVTTFSGTHQFEKTAMASVTIPAGLVKLDQGAFYAMPNLTELIFAPNSNLNEFAQGYAFTSSSNLKVIINFPAQNFPNNSKFSSNTFHSIASNPIVIFSEETTAAQGNDFMNNSNLIDRWNTTPSFYVRPLTDPNISTLLAANVTIAQLLAAGVTVIQMVSGGVTVKQLLDEGYTIAQLLAADVPQTQIDIALTEIKIHSGFTIRDGAQNESIFTTNDAVYTPATFAAKLNTDLGYAENTITAGGDLTTTDSTPYYRLYLQFAEAVTLTNMPKDIFNIPFSDFSVKAGGQVNLRNVNLDADMTITKVIAPVVLSQLGTNIDGEVDATTAELFGFDAQINADGSIAVVGAPVHDGKGTMRIYQYSTPGQPGGSWTQLGTDIDGVTGDNFGRDVAVNIDGSIVAGGAYSNGGGTIRIYKYSKPGQTAGSWDTDGSWEILGSSIDGLPGDYGMGMAVSLSSDGSIVASGSYSTDGVARIYQYSTPGVTGGSWTILGSAITGPGQLGRDLHLSSDGSIIAIGANQDNNMIGSTGIYKYSKPGQIAGSWDTDGSWEILGAKIPGVTANGKSGFMVRISADGSIVAMGAPWGVGGGQVQIYKYSTPDDEWQILGAVITENGGEFGIGLALSADGSIVAIGAQMEDNEKGAAHIYKYSDPGQMNGSWDKVESIYGIYGKADEGIANGERSGRTSLSADGRILLVGGYKRGPGVVRVYNLPYPGVTNTSTIPAGNNFINNFVSTIETDLDLPLSYDASNALIEFVGLGQDISMNITSNDTTIFDTTITEITAAANTNTLPFITYGQPDPTLTNYIDNGITVSEFLSNGYTITQLYKGGFIPDWTFDTDANHFAQSYVKDFIDISGSLVLRENASLTVNGNIETKGNVTIKNQIMEADLTLNHNMLVGGDISMNGNVTVGDVSMNGTVVDCSFTDASIPESAINGQIGPDYTQPTILYDKGFDTTADVSMNANVQISNLKVDGNIEFSDGTTMNTYDDNIQSSGIVGGKNTTTFNNTTIESPVNSWMTSSEDGKYVYMVTGRYTKNPGAMYISSDSGETWTTSSYDFGSTPRFVSGIDTSSDGKYIITGTSNSSTRVSNKDYRVHVSSNYGVDGSWSTPITAGWGFAYKGISGAAISATGKYMAVMTCSQANQTKFSSDFGINWSDQKGFTEGPWIEENTWLKMSYDGKYLYGGKFPLKYVNTTNNPFSVHTIDPGSNTGTRTISVSKKSYLVAWTNTISNSDIYIMTDGISKQAITSLPVSAHPKCIHIDSNDNIYVGVNKVIYKSADNGTSWSQYTIDVTPTANIGHLHVTPNFTFLGVTNNITNSYGNYPNAPTYTRLAHKYQIIYKPSTFTSLTISNTLTAGSFSTSSDYRIKTDISQLDETVTLDNLRPVKYLQTLINKPQYGLIAHELQEYYPDLVVGEKDGEEWQRVNYTGLIALLINEIKQLKRELTELENGM